MGGNGWPVHLSNTPMMPGPHCRRLCPIRCTGPTPLPARSRWPICCSTSCPTPRVKRACSSPLQRPDCQPCWAGTLVQGMDATMAISLAAASFASLTAFTLDACECVAGELATPLGLADDGDRAGEGGPPRIVTEIAPEPPKATPGSATPTLAESQTSALAFSSTPASSPAASPNRRAGVRNRGVLASAERALRTYNAAGAAQPPRPITASHDEAGSTSTVPA
jgi:hypothetical protein